jgi:outer membrane protein assembly factor BamB
MSRLFMCLCLVVIGPLVVCLAESPAELNWDNWRGPNFNGQAAASARPPVKWDAQTNIRWVADLPGQGSATPIVWGDKLFVLSAEETKRKAEKPPVANQTSKTEPPGVYFKFWVTCIDPATGKNKWQKLATEQVPHEGRHNTHTYAAGSPTTDGQHLYASFASRGIYCYTLDGELKWQVDLGDMHTRFGWGEAVTPVLAGELLIVNWDQEEGSFITALNKNTGKAVWKVDRPGEATSWNTPLIVSHAGRQMAVVNGTHRAQAYDVQTGEVIWSCGGQTINAIPSPIKFGDTVICMSGYRGAACMSIPLDSIGDITDKAQTRWKWDQGTPYVPSPALSDSRLYFTGANADILQCLDAATGKPLAERKRLSGVVGLYSSPLIAGGHVYFAGREGGTVVIKDDPSLEIVAVNKLEGTFDASPVAIGNQLFLRSWNKLYCIAQ